MRGREMSPGVQVSSFRPILKNEQQVSAVFERIAAMGCDTVQLQWIDSCVSPEAIARALERYGIRSVSTQGKYDEAIRQKEYLIRLNHLCGSRFFCVSGIPERFRTKDGLRDFREELRRLASYAFVEQECWEKDPFLCLEEAFVWLCGKLG